MEVYFSFSSNDNIFEISNLIIVIECHLNKVIIPRYFNLISSTMQNTGVWMMPFCGCVKVFGEGSRDPTGLPM